jgi:hypothetical protein
MVLVVSGSMGAGKTTMLGELSDLLTAERVAHAAIDLDWLGLVYVANPPADLAFRNLAAVWPNYAALGVERLLLALAVESASEVEQIRAATGGDLVTVCRLRASISVMQERVRLREPGMLQSHFVRRVSDLEARLDSANLADFEVSNERRSLSVVAREILVRARWLTS